MRALPNLTVLEVGDATEVEGILPLVCSIPGPVYVRMLRGEIPRLFDAAEPMALDTPRVISEGDDLLIVSSGICTEEAMRAAAALRARGVSVGHLHVSTLKPFAHPRFAQWLERPQRGILTVENHTTIGGLGSLVALKLVEHGLVKPLAMLGLQDTFAHGASRHYLMREHGMDAAAIIRESERLLGEKLAIGEADLAAVRIEAVHSAAKAEAL